MAKEKETKKELQIEVGDPQVLRPVDLPLVVKPADGGEWENEAQAEFARVLNGYAYKNPAKWEAKKAVLVEQLKALGKNPSSIVTLRGNDSRLKFKNKALQVDEA